ncbi:hypothetical protein [Streptomyces anandii]|uniref:hypothetical protein n=1 Tax=Streptomyces anandii TaxID=285454 RepID=UPI0016792A97|nr:hypothetical protein [Streptomyces anandii]GGX73121.1 hypothetical protein GCM10010510_17360 [Streptomyces anandii JCM 4720]
MTHVGTALVSRLVGVLIGLTGNPNADKASPSATVTTTATATGIAAANSQPSAGKVPSDGVPGDGTYVVGNDV